MVQQVVQKWANANGKLAEIRVCQTSKQVYLAGVSIGKIDKGAWPHYGTGVPDDLIKALDEMELWGESGKATVEYCVFQCSMPIFVGPIVVRMVGRNAKIKNLDSSYAYGIETCGSSWLKLIRFWEVRVTVCDQSVSSGSTWLSSSRGCAWSWDG